MFNSRESTNSQLDLRNLDNTKHVDNSISRHNKDKTIDNNHSKADSSDTCHLRVLVRQHKLDKDQESRIESSIKANNNNNNNSSQLIATAERSHSKWLPKLTSSTSVSSSRTQHSLRDRLSQKMARISSLDSTRSSSSTEVESSGDLLQQNQRATTQVMPLISITSNHDTVAPLLADRQSLSKSVFTNQAPASENQRIRHERYNNYYGRSRFGLAHDQGEEEEDDDDFDDPPLPIPYSSSSMSRSNVIRQITNSQNIVDALGRGRDSANYEDLLDDRQGMNNNDQQFTKGEKVNRASIDGSIISELRSDGSKKSSSSKGGSSSRKDEQRRSKSPSSSSAGNKRSSRHSRRGIMGFASRLKLTKKHDSIAKLQLAILNSGFLSLKTMDRDLQSFLPKERMTPRDFQDRVKLMRKYEVLSTIEYRFASRYETYVCKHATQDSNQGKNNYKKCIPYDYNRVVLKTLPSVPDSDYINASHVDSYLKPNAYIAAQGPNESTIEDFWRMIWEQKTFVVVMLTKVFDFIRVMCNQYWPVELNKPERYGNLEVTLLYEEPLADFVIRTIRLTKLKSSQRELSQELQQQEEALDGIKTGKKDRLSDGQSDSDDYEQSDDTSGSGELELINGMSILDQLRAAPSQQQVSSGSRERVPSVRSPKFTAKPKSHRERNSSSNELRVGSNSANRLSSSDLGDTGALTGKQLSRSASQPRELENARRPDEFLHPLFGATHLASSSASIPSTPNTPRTPTSLGLDRSSATRKAVKKKRRARVKNTRPMRTKFQVPDESQLLDDDDDDNEADETDVEALDEPNGDPSKANQSNERIIYQFHYNSWASHTCPFINSLLHFRRRVRICMDEMSKSGKTGPTIVHCNDGCGRTGTYLCIDANLELAEEDNVYDVYNYTKKMRQSRKFLIENLEQYKFVYDTIEEAMFCGKTWFPVSELHKRLKHKSQRNPITKKNEYLREYEKITRMTSKFSIGDCAGGHRVENREKNRDVSTVPPDNFRPYLTSFQSNDSTDYINAVFVDGYTRSKEYIVTEWPLHKTISDFWSLIYDHDCNSVILLANPGESSTYPSFLPTEKELRRKFGPVFSAEMVSYTHYQNIKSWIYTINKKIVSLTEVIAGVKSEAKTTQVFQITCWPQGHRVPTSTNALVELMNMVERWRQRTAYGPVCVVSLNGKSRAGVYCAANVAIEQVVQHSEVDVFQAVKTVRRHRPQLIENMTEYKYCYDLILHYVLHYVNQTTAPT